jgi:hypothetical protein
VAAAGCLSLSYRAVRVPLLCVWFFSWLIDVTDGYNVSIGVHLAFAHHRYVFSGSFFHGSIHRGTM